MLEKTASQLALLKDILPGLLDAVNHYILNKPKREEAQAEIKRSSKLGEYGEEAFHARVAAQLHIIKHKTDESDVTKLATLDSVGATLNDLFKTWEQILGPQNHPVSEEFVELRWISEHKKLKTTHYLRLKCPPPEYREQVGILQKACIDALKADLIHSGILGIAKTEVSEWDSARKFFQDFECLQEIWSERWYQNACPACESHEALFSLHLPHGGSMRASLRFRRSDLVNAWEPAEITLDCATHQWTSSGVPEMGTTSAGHIPIHSAEGYRSVESICHSFQDPSGRNHFLVCQGSLLTTTNTSSNLESLPMTPLREMADLSLQGVVTSIQDAAEKDRLIPAVVLAYMYLHLSGSEWWPDNMAEPDIWFNFHAPGSKCSWQPFLALPPSQSRNLFSYRQFNKKRPSLPALGKLLLEIWVGKPLTFGSTEWKAAEEQCRQTGFGQDYLDVVGRCITSGSALNRKLQKQGHLRIDNDMRDQFLDEVVKVLQYLALRANRAEGMEDLLANFHFEDANGARTFPKPPVGEVTIQSTADSAGQANRNSAPLTQPRIETKEPVHRAPPDPLVEAANAWFEVLETRTQIPLFPKRRHDNFVKVAILDTGADIARFSGRVKEYRSWCSSGQPEGENVMGKGNQVPLGGVDADGHGTHAVDCLLKICINCDVYVAKVFENRYDMKSDVPDLAMAQRIANAIRYAANTWQVDIISLSFGFKESDAVIEDAINLVTNPTATTGGQISQSNEPTASSGSATEPARPVLIFAAASNSGARDQIAWPATHDRVICIHAADGNGDKYGGNPAPGGSNVLSTLGCGVEGWFKGKIEAKSGTSVATPIAAGIAALVLDITRFGNERNRYLEYMCSKSRGSGDDERENYKNRCGRLRTCAGMSAVLRKMAKKHDHKYRFIAPWHVLRLNKNEFAGSIVQNILNAVEQGDG